MGEHAAGEPGKGDTMWMVSDHVYVSWRRAMATPLQTMETRPKAIPVGTGAREHYIKLTGAGSGVAARMRAAVAESTAAALVDVLAPVFPAR